MEGMREIAIAYYERAPEKEKDLFEAFFSKIDVNGDGNISLAEFKNSLGSIRLSFEDVFNQLDANGDGILDFFEVLTLYYIVNKVTLPNCTGCSCLLVGPYFSCLLCLGKGSATYDLCCGCYRGGKSGPHEHSVDNMKDHHSLLMLLRSQDKTSKNNAIEELQEIAKSYYKAGSAEAKTLAYEFFKSMDTDGDDRVDLGEFLTFLKQEGYGQMRSHYFFSELDQNGDGTLDFWEVMTLYYIIKSGRPICDGCGKFIPGMYFSCVECFNGVGSSFTLCLDCYRCPSARCNHTHNGPAQFLDNYTLLKATKDSSALVTTAWVNQRELKSCPTSNVIVPAAVPQSNVYLNTEPTYNTSYATAVYPNYYNTNAIVPVSAVPQSNVYLNTGPSYNTSYATAVYPYYYNTNAIVPVSNLQKWSVALRAFEVALNVGSIAATLCTIM